MKYRKIDDALIQSLDKKDDLECLLLLSDDDDDDDSYDVDAIAYMNGNDITCMAETKNADTVELTRCIGHHSICLGKFKVGDVVVLRLRSGSLSYVLIDQFYRVGDSMKFCFAFRPLNNLLRCSKKPKLSCSNILSSPMQYLEMMVATDTVESCMYSVDKIVRKVNVFRDAAHIQEHEKYVSASSHNACVIASTNESIRINYYIR